MKRGRLKLRGLKLEKGLIRWFKPYLEERFTKDVAEQLARGESIEL